MRLPSKIVLLVLALCTAVQSPGYGRQSDVASRDQSSEPPRHSQEMLDALHHAAARGDHAAQAELGGLYFAGVSVPRDYEKAEAFLRMAMVDAKPAYQRNLACVLYHRGGEERLRESTGLIEQASAGHDLLALLYESRLYRLGVDRPINPTLGLYKLEQALGRIYGASEDHEAERRYLQTNVPHILGLGVCGPADAYGAFLAKSFPMRYRAWPTRGHRSQTNPLFLYLNGQ